MATVQIADVIKGVPTMGDFKYVGPDKSAKNAYVFETAEKSQAGRSTLLQHISSVYGGKFNRDYYRSHAGSADIGIYHIILKPSASAGGATEKLSIQSSNLIKGGTKGKFNWSGLEFSEYSFTTASQLKASIEKSVNANGKIPKNIKSLIIKQILGGDGKKFTWPIDAEQYVKNELGKYLGELLFGYNALNGMWPKKIGRLVVPDDPTFSAIDSLLEQADGELFPISSKFGQGAAASFFANILPKGIAHKNEIANSVLKDIITTTERIGVTNTNRNGNRILMEYGVRSILDIKPSMIKDPMQVFDEVVKHNYLHPAVQETVMRIQKLTTNDTILQNLPQSITGFFSREMANRLNADAKSMDAMLSILSGKNFYQVNLDIASWNKGIIKYSMVKTDKVSLTIIGTKSATNLIKQKQGIVNYILKAS